MLDTATGPFVSATKKFLSIGGLILPCVRRYSDALFNSSVPAQSCLRLFFINKNKCLSSCCPGVVLAIPATVQQGDQPMPKRNLVVFENEKVCPQALTYARELALRLDSEVTLLMLVEMAFWDRRILGSKRSAVAHLERRMGKLLTAFSAEFLNHGIAVTAALRMGDPAQELIKFLAERPPFQVIIWGSDEAIPERRPSGRSHWISKVAGTLECPLFSVSTRERDVESNRPGGD